MTRTDRLWFAGVAVALGIWIPIAVSLAIRHESKALMDRVIEKAEDVGRAFDDTPPGPEADRPKMSGVAFTSVGDVVTFEISDPIIIDRDSGERLLLVAVTVENTTPKRKLDDLVFRSALKDNWGNNYNETIAWLEGRPTFDGNLLPGENSIGVLMFEPPMDGFEYLDLDLSIGPDPGLFSFSFDAIDTAHVRIPQSAIITMDEEAWLLHRGVEQPATEASPPPTVTLPYEIEFPKFTFTIERVFRRVSGSDEVLVVAHKTINTTQNEILDTLVVVSIKDNWGNDYERASGWNSLDGEPRSTPRMRPGQSSSDWDKYETPLEGYSSLTIAYRIIDRDNWSLYYGQGEVVIDAAQSNRLSPDRAGTDAGGKTQTEEQPK